MGAEYYVAQVALSHFGKAVPSDQPEICAKGSPGFSRASLGLFDELDVPKGMELPEGTDFGSTVTVSALGILL